MKLTKNLLMALLACCFTTLSFAQVGKKKMQLLTIGASSNGKTVNVKKAQLFNVLFKKECRGCRDIWHITSPESDIIKSVKNSHSNPSCTNCTGGHQDHTFVFKALKPGKTTLSFEYMEERFTVDIAVK